MPTATGLQTARLPAPAAYEPDPGTRAIYLRAVREAGLPALQVIAIVSILGYLGYLFLDCSTSDCSGRVVPRLGLIGLNLALLATARLAPQFTVDHYDLVLGTLLVLLVPATVLSSFRLLVNGGVATSPIVLLVLFVLYVFFRLPAWALLLIGVGSSVAGYVLGFRFPVAQEEDLRTLVYLAMVHAVGFALARSIEQRERRLHVERLRVAHNEAELKERTRVAEQAIAEKNRLIASIGHDLRQPLMAARLHVDILRAQLNAGERAAAHRQAVELADGLAQVQTSVDNLLMESRDAGGASGFVADIRLESVLHRISWVFEDACRQRGLQLRVVLRDPTLTVHTDGESLFRVLVNLVGNAVKFSRPPSLRPDGRPAVRGIVLQAVACDDRVLIRVADNGIGMAAGERERVWDAFYQSGPAIARHREGLGLGLYLVRRTLQKLPFHEVSLRSSPNVGTRFTLSMPRAPASGRSAPGPSAPGPSAPAPSASAPPASAPSASAPSASAPSGSPGAG